MIVDLAALRVTRKKINAGIWVCAALTMTASAISGVTSFYVLQKDGWGIASGAMTALAVDVALWVVLTGDQLLERIGLTSGSWGRALRWGTAAMSIILNCLAAVLAPIGAVLKAPLILIHAFVPLIMVGLAEYRGECAQKFAPAERDALQEIEAPERVADTPIVAPSERISEARPPELQAATVTPFAYRSERADAAPARPRPDQRKLSFPPSQQRPDLRVSTPTGQAAARRSTPVRDAAFRWLDRHHNPAEVTAAKLAAAIDASPHTCKKLLGEWRKNRQEVAS
jgi:hypothetical protein